MSALKAKHCTHQENTELTITQDDCKLTLITILVIIYFLFQQHCK